MNASDVEPRANPADLPSGQVDALVAQVNATGDLAWMVREELRVLATGFYCGYVERLVDGFLPPSLVDEHRARYEHAARFAAGKSVLDMACGSGFGSDYLRGPGDAAEVLGVDIDPDAVRYARIRYGREGLSFQQADACAAWTDRQFDLIVSFETIEHVPYPDRMLDNVVRMLRPGAPFIVSTPIRNRGTITDPPGNPHHIREWSVNEFMQLMRQYFAEVEVQYQAVGVREYVRAFRIPRRVVRTYLRTRGYDARALESLQTSLILPGNVPRSWALNPPQFLVATCRGQRTPEDPVAVQRLCYGDAPLYAAGAAERTASAT